jgi:hypothetical protein
VSDLELARRLVACKHFRYLPGMLDDSGRRIVRVDGARLTVVWHGNPHHRLAPDISIASPTDFRPDLDDPATVGALKGIVQQTLGHDGASVIVTVEFFPTQMYGVVQWRATPILWTSRDIGGHDHSTEPAALVAALETA